MNDVADTPAAPWLDVALRELDTTGLTVVPGVMANAARERTRRAFCTAADGVRRELGADRVQTFARTIENELRLAMKFDPHFLSLLEYPELLALVDRFLAPSAILRFQHGIVVTPGEFDTGEWHMNGRRVLNGYRAALDVVFAVDDLHGPEFLFALGTHQRRVAPSLEELETLATSVPVPAGAVLVFDSTLWHRQGTIDRSDRALLVAHQFTRHFIKPHIDYVRALGDDVVSRLPARTRRLLGWEARVPASLAEFYVDPEQRLYVAGQE